MSAKIRAHVFISGRVQGVFFRENTKKRADECGVFGWVKNLPDGQVEAVFEGERESVEKMIKWARRGPFFASVKNLDLKLEEFSGEYSLFEIKNGE